MWQPCEGVCVQGKPTCGAAGRGVRPPLAAELQCTACYGLPIARQCECGGQGVGGRQVGLKRQMWRYAVVGSLHVTAQTLVLVVGWHGPVYVLCGRGFLHRRNICPGRFCKDRFDGAVVEDVV